MLSLLVREINTHNTAISAIDIEFHPDHNNCFHQSGRSWPNSIGFARLAQTNTYITKWSPLHMIVFSSHRRSFCIYYKVISPPLDRFCLLIKDHFAYITKRSPLHLIAFVCSSKIVQPHIGEQTPGRGNRLRSATILDSTLLKARSHFFVCDLSIFIIMCRHICDI